MSPSPMQLNKKMRVMGKMIYKGKDKVIPKDCWMTCVVWTMIVVPATFILVFV
jgi:hypothetical protein